MTTKPALWKTLKGILGREREARNTKEPKEKCTSKLREKLNKQNNQRSAQEK